ncbi:hypothetical protein M2145_001019 [Lachnospiraceae bacterium PF1-21]|uniref:PcfB family protein n=1 Tax=Ohessyouella blattaphilus TaxID=2949333 RepID=UPI003E1DD5A6
MNNGGDAAEQIVHMSLEGVEVAAKITGTGAKNIAVLLIAALNETQKTKGKSRLSNMLKSGKELKVFSIQNQDQKKFVAEAKRYGVLYCVLRDKNKKEPTAEVDIIARAEDASKIQRIMERFSLATVDKASVVQELERDPFVKRAEEKPLSEKNSASTKGSKKPSVREKLKSYDQAKTKNGPTPEKTKALKVPVRKER